MGAIRTQPVATEPREGVAPVVRALVKSGAGSAASALANAAAVKLVAAGLGPAGVALLATLQQVRQAALVWATGNGQTALIQGGAARQGCAQREYLRTVLIVFAVGTLVTAVVLVAAAGPLAARLAGSPERAALVAWLALPVTLGAAVVYLTGLLNVARAIGRMALVQVAAGLAMCATAWPAVLLFRAGHAEGLAAMLAASAALALAVGAALLWPYRGLLEEWLRAPGRWFRAEALRRFLAVSGAMFYSGVISTGALLVVRAGIIRAEGLERAGLFDAAWAISMNYVALVLSSFQSYYLPALAGARGGDERRDLISRVLEVSTLVLAPLVVAMIVWKSLVLTLLYSGTFQGAATSLRWTLVGDYLKVTSWVLGMPMLAVADMRIFLTTETAVQALFISSAWLAGRWLGAAEAAAIAFVLLYGANCALSLWYVRRRHGFRPKPSSMAMWAAGLAMVLAASAHTWRDQAVDPAKALAWTAGAAALGLLGARRLEWSR